VNASFFASLDSRLFLPCNSLWSFITACQATIFASLTITPPHDKMGGMSRKPVTNVLLALIVAGLLLPVMICIVMALASLLAALGDRLGGAVLQYVGLAGGVLWIMVLVALIIVQAIHTLGEPDDPDQ
jgi:hypothetical protein